MKTLYAILVIIFLTACSCEKKKNADLIIHNATIYTVDSAFSIAEALAMKDGKFVAVGSSKMIKATYKALETIDAQGKTIVPGLIDAHCHFYGLGLQQQKVDLTGTTSFKEVIQRIVDFQKEKNVNYITGRGWDQNDWEVQEFPTKDKLDSLFPRTPIAVTRIDGHALLANQAAIDLAGVSENTLFSGGDILKKDGKLTGIFVDNPMELITSAIPKPSREESINALLDAQKICFDYGITTVDDAGLDRDIIELIDSLQKSDELKIRIYAMASATEDNLNHYLKNGILKTDKLNVRSFKFFSDGALGSRGAVLREPYSDHPGHYGAMVTPTDSLLYFAQRIAASDFQMNTHAIGDSANHIILQTYKNVLQGKTNRRWKVEHAQVISPEDFDLFDDIIPSVQPTHATSDMYWAEERLGTDRIKSAYAYKQLLEKYGKVALGTDFPVEQVSPFLTFYAAVARKDLNNYPEGGFQMENGLTRKETLMGMTVWAAYSNFEENEKGSIERGKFADFILLDQNIMEIALDKVPKIKVLNTYISGNKVN